MHVVGLEAFPGSTGRGKEVGKGRKGRDRGCTHEQDISIQMVRSPLRAPQGDWVRPFRGLSQGVQQWGIYTATSIQLAESGSLAWDSRLISPRTGRAPPSEEALRLGLTGVCD